MSTSRFGDKITGRSAYISAVSSMPDLDNTAEETFPEKIEGEDSNEDRRAGATDRRTGDKDRRDPERVAEEIAPRRHPDIKGRRSTDK